MCVFFSELKNDDFAEIMSIYYINFVSSKNKNVEKYRILVGDCHTKVFILFHKPIFFS